MRKMTDGEWQELWRRADQELEKAGPIRINYELLPDARDIVRNSEDHATEALKPNLPSSDCDHLNFAQSYAAGAEIKSSSDEDDATAVLKPDLPLSRYDHLSFVLSYATTAEIKSSRDELEVGAILK